MKKVSALFVLLMILSASTSIAEMSFAPSAKYKSLVIEDIVFDGAEMEDWTPENQADFTKVRDSIVQEFRNVIRKQINSERIFTSIVSKPTGSKEELVLQTRFMHIKLGDPVRRMARYFMPLLIPLGGTFEITIKGRLVDGDTGKEIKSLTKTTNTGWYNGGTDAVLVRYAKNLAEDYASLVESFMTEEHFILPQAVPTW